MGAEHNSHLASIQASQNNNPAVYKITAGAGLSNVDKAGGVLADKDYGVQLKAGGFLGTEYGGQGPLSKIFQGLKGEPIMGGNAGASAGAGGGHHEVEGASHGMVSGGVTGGHNVPMSQLGLQHPDPTPQVGVGRSEGMGMGG